MKNDKIFSAAIKLWEPQDVIDWTTGFKYDFSKYKTKFIDNKVNGHYLLYNLNKRFLSGTIGIVEDYEVNYFMSIVDKLRNLVFNNRYDTLQRYYLQATIISNNIKSLAGKIPNSDFKFRENSIKLIYKDLENLIKLFNDIIYWLSRCNPETASNESFQTIRTSTFFLCIELINVTGKVFKTYLEIVKEAVSPKTPAPNIFTQKSLPTPVDFNNNKELSAKHFLNYQNEPSYLHPTTPIKIDENLFKDLIKSMDVIIKFCSVVVRSATQFDPDIFLTPFNYRRLTLKSLVPLSALSKSSDQLNATNMFDQQMPITQNIQNGNKKDENLTIITISGKNGKNYHTANGDNEIVISAKLSDSHSLQNIGSPVESQHEHIGQNSWGFELKLENDWYTISKLVPQTPAAQSNRLDVGDQVLLIAHRLILGWEMEKVCKLLTEVDNDPYLILITRTHIKWATNSNNPNNSYNLNHNKYNAIYSANCLISPPLNAKIGSGDPRSPDSLWSPSASAMIKVKSPRPTTNTDLFQKKWYYENNSKFKLPSSFKSAGIQSLDLNNSLNTEGKISNDNTITSKKYRQPTFSDMFRKSVSDSDKSHHGRSIRMKKNSKNDEQLSASPTNVITEKGATKSLSAHSIKSLFTKTFLPFFSHKKEKRSHFIFPHPFRKSKILHQNVPKTMIDSSQTTNSSPTHEEETSSPTTDYNKIFTNNNNVSSTNVYAKTDVSQSLTNKLLNDHKIPNSLSCGMSEILANEHDEGSPFKSCLSNASISPNHNNCEENVFVSNRFLDYYLPYHHFPTVVASHNNNQSEEIKDEKTNKEENIKNDENFGKNAKVLKPENSNSIVKQINPVHSTDNTSIRVLTKDHEFQQALDLADTFANPNLERKRSSLDKSLPPSPTDSIDSGTPSTPVDFYQTWVLVKKIDIIENHHKISVVTLPKSNDENKAGQSPTTMHKNSLDSSQIINKSTKEDISISKDSTFLHSPKYPGQPINGRSDRSVSTFASAISNLMPSLKTGWSQCRSVIYFCSTNTNNSIFSQSPASTSSKLMQINETKVSGSPSDTTNSGGVMPSQSSCIDPELLQNLPYLYLQSPFWDKMENQMKFLTQTIYVPDFMVRPSIRMHNCIKLTSSYCIIYMALPSNSEFKRWLEKLKPVSHGYFEIMECDVNKDDVAGHDTLGANSSSAMKKSTSFLTKLEKLHNILK